MSNSQTPEWYCEYSIHELTIHNNTVIAIYDCGWEDDDGEYIEDWVGFPLVLGPKLPA